MQLARGVDGRRKGLELMSVDFYVAWAVAVAGLDVTYSIVMWEAKRRRFMAGLVSLFVFQVAVLACISIATGKS